MTVRARPRRQPVLRRHLLPRPAAARAAGVPAGAGGAGRRVARTAATTYAAWPATCATTCAAGAPCPRAASTGRSSTRAVDAAGRRSTTPSAAASGAPRSSRRRWCWSSCSGDGSGARPGDGGRDPGGDGPRRDPRPARRRLRPLQRRRRLGGAALREDALRQRPAAAGLRRVGHRRRGLGGRGHRRLPARASCGPPRAASPRPSTPTPRAPRARSTSGRRSSSSRCSAPTTGRGRPRLLSGDRRRHVRARHLDPAAARGPRRPRALVRRASGGCATRASSGSGPPATTRWSRPGTAWRSAASASPAPLTRAPGVRRRGGRRRRAARCGLHVVDGRLRRVSRDGVVGRAGRGAGGLRLRRGRLPRPGPGHRRRALARPGRRPARRRPSTTSGPTTAASTTPPTTPRRWWPGPATRPTTPARPGCRRRCTRWRRTPRSPAPAGTGRPRRRRWRRSRALAERAPRFAGWSLAAAEAMLDGPLEIAVVGPARAGARRPRGPGPPGAGRGGRRRRRAARRHPAAGRADRGGRPPGGVRLPAPGV